MFTNTFWCSMQVKRQLHGGADSGGPQKFDTFIQIYINIEVYMNKINPTDKNSN